MKRKTLIILLVLSLTFNLITGYYIYRINYDTGLTIEQRFVRVNKYINLATNNLDAALTAEGPTEFYNKLFIADRQLFLVYGETNRLVSLIGRRYLVDVSELPHEIFEIYRDIQMVKGEFTKNDLQKPGEKGEEALKRASARLKELTQILIRTKVNRRDLKKLNNEI